MSELLQNCSKLVSNKEPSSGKFAHQCAQSIFMDINKFCMVTAPIVNYNVTYYTDCYSRLLIADEECFVKLTMRTELEILLNVAKLGGVRDGIAALISLIFADGGISWGRISLVCKL